MVGLILLRGFRVGVRMLLLITISLILLSWLSVFGLRRLMILRCGTMVTLCVT